MEINVATGYCTLVQGMTYDLFDQKVFTIRVDKYFIIHPDSFFKGFRIILAIQLAPKPAIQLP